MLYMQIMIPHTKKKNMRNLPNNSDFQALTSNNYLAKPIFQQKKESCEIHNRIFFLPFLKFYFLFTLSLNYVSPSYILLHITKI